MSEPDYPNYSLEELRDAQRHIDAGRYPERAAILQQEIERRRGRTTVAAAPNSEPQPLPHRNELVLPKRTIGAFLAVSGVISFARTMDLMTFTGGVAAAPLFLVMVISYGGMVVAGLCLWNRWRVGPFIGLVALAFQIPFIQAGRFTYMISAVPTVELKLWPLFGFNLSTFNAFSIWIHEAPQSFYLGFNVVALTLTVILVDFFIRQRQALERLKARKTVGSENPLPSDPGVSRDGSGSVRSR